MELDEYQRRAAQTDQRRGDDLSDVVVHLLGLAGEAGSVAAEYKKYLRDGPAHTYWKMRMREELGDVLWYLASICNHLDLSLGEIAAANLEKTKDRWEPGDTAAIDASWPEEERLPRTGTYELRPTTNDRGREVVELYFNGSRVGDPLTDASVVDDGYRFHDIFHIAYAVLLGWSPVTRALLRRKRKSNPAVDENEDGGRGVVIEEGVAALVFGYASKHEFLKDVTRLDQRLLDTIAMVTGPLEVGGRSAADWERAILTGFDLFRQLQDHNGGFIDFDADASMIAFRSVDLQADV
jgi:NTP pyrophosphatase (non-canonical NTP hydrolase)